VQKNIFMQHRNRLLIISKDYFVRDNLVTLLTGYGYYVDYVDNRHDGLIKFREHKHDIAIIDVHSLPHVPSHLFKAFKIYQRNPVIVIAAQIDELSQIYPYLYSDVYDIIRFPLNMDYLDIALKRIVNYNELIRKNGFLKMLITIFLLTAPVWIAFFHILLRWWGK